MVRELTDFNLVEYATVVKNTPIKFFWSSKCSGRWAQVGEVKTTGPGSPSRRIPHEENSRYCVSNFFVTSACRWHRSLNSAIRLHLCRMALLTKSGYNRQIDSFPCREFWDLSSLQAVCKWVTVESRKKKHRGLLLVSYYSKTAIKTCSFVKRKICT